MGTAQSGKRVAGEVIAFAKLLAALATMKRRDRISEFDVEVYESATAHIPLPILSRAVTKILTTQDWFPTVQELLAACEAVRLEMRGLVQFTRCDGAECSVQGWVERVVEGTFRMVRCECWQRHQETVKQLGVPEQPLALPPARESEWSHVGDD